MDDPSKANFRYGLKLAGRLLDRAGLLDLAAEGFRVEDTEYGLDLQIFDRNGGFIRTCSLSWQEINRIEAVETMAIAHRRPLKYEWGMAMVGLILQSYGEVQGLRLLGDESRVVMRLERSASIGVQEEGPIEVRYEWTQLERGEGVGW